VALNGRNHPVASQYPVEQQREDSMKDMVRFIAEALADEFYCRFDTLEKLGHSQHDILLNCTSIGMHPDVDETPVPKEYLRKDMIVFDTVYNPLETQLLKEAKEIGATTISGAEMFINQAAEQFKLFTHSQPNMTVLRNTVLNALIREGDDQ
jgi:3-dehydroquinate dehydratase/shikimate dehydrogenase